MSQRVPTHQDHGLGTSLSVLAGGPHDYDRLLDDIGDARFVLLGEASHGTREFYRERARITQRLIEEKGFDAVALEADWPDAHRVHRWVQGSSEDASAECALASFTRFPTWMWRNREVVSFLAWLRRTNQSRPPVTSPASPSRVGIYGLDLYSLYASVDAIITYLDGVDPAAAARARERYECLGLFGRDTTAYAYAAGLGVGKPCEDRVLEQLHELRQRALDAAHPSNSAIGDELFYVEQNARLVKNAEEYYRSLFRGGIVTWNMRDRHMADTLGTLVEHLDRRLGRPCKIAVWAHNSHLGDARATEMGSEGELNVGQLVRERYGRQSFSIGFSTYEGEVTAASDWDAPAETKKLRPALEGSYEAFFHALGIASFVVHPDGDGRLPAALRRQRLQRAVGVVYRPQTERRSHWFEARLADQFDAVIHIDRTSAVEPLERGARGPGPDAPETFPFAV